MSVSRVEFAVDFAQARSVDVGIDFGGADVGVAEQFLDDPQVRPVFQQVRGEAVAEHVRRYVSRPMPGPRAPAA